MQHQEPKSTLNSSANNLNITANSHLLEEQKELFYLLIHFAKEQIKEDPSKRIFVVPIMKLNSIIRSANNNIFQNLKVLHNITYEFVYKELDKCIPDITSDKSIDIDIGFVSGYKLLSSYYVFHRNNVDNIKATPLDKQAMKEKILIYDRYITSFYGEEEFYQNFIAFTLSPQVISDLMYSKNFTHIVRYGVMFKLEKKYSIKLFQYLLENPSVTIKVEEFKEIFDLESRHYKRQNDFTAKLLEPVIFEIKEKTGATIFYDIFSNEEGIMYIKVIMTILVVENYDNPLDKLREHEKKYSLSKMLADLGLKEDEEFLEKLKEAFRGSDLMQPYYLGLPYLPSTIFSVDKQYNIVNNVTGEKIGEEEERELVKRIKEKSEKVGDTTYAYLEEHIFKDLFIPYKENGNEKIRHCMVVGVTEDKKENSFVLTIVDYEELYPTKFHTKLENSVIPLHREKFHDYRSLSVFVNNNMEDRGVDLEELETLNISMQARKNILGYYRFWSVKDRVWRRLGAVFALHDVNELFRSEKSGLVQYNPTQTKKLTKKQHSNNMKLTSLIKYAIAHRREDLHHFEESNKSE